MLLKNKPSRSMNNISFEQFKKQILASGRSPESILNELLSSGKVSQSQLQNIINLANKNKHLIK